MNYRICVPRGTIEVSIKKKEKNFAFFSLYLLLAGSNWLLLIIDYKFKPRLAVLSDIFVVFLER